MSTLNVADIRKAFGLMYMHNVQDQHPEGMLELLGASFVTTEESIFGEQNVDYMVAERDWYDTQQCNVNPLNDLYGKVPVIWKEHAANTRGEINSNYGWCVYSKENGSQYDNVLRELKTNPNSRRATMIYTRPTMHNDYREDGKNDFICTNAVTYYIRNGVLQTVVQMRSNDVVFGYMNDYYWAQVVASRLAIDLDIESNPDMFWQAQSLHIYPRHFHHVAKWCKENL